MDRHGVLLFLDSPDSPDSHKGFLNWLSSETESQTEEAVLYLERTLSCSSVCVPMCELCTWAHIVAHGDGQQLKFYMWLMNYTE